VLNTSCAAHTDTNPVESSRRRSDLRMSCRCHPGRFHSLSFQRTRLTKGKPHYRDCQALRHNDSWPGGND
jgi:hypothetical protein